MIDVKERNAVETAPAATGRGAADDLQDIQGRVLDLIVGAGSLESTLQAIAQTIDVMTPDCGCFISWRSGTRDEPTAVVSSKQLPKEVVERLTQLATGGFDFVVENASTALASLGSFSTKTIPIVGSQGEPLGLITLVTKNDISSDADMTSRLTTLSAMASFAILSEVRTRAFGEANERFAALAKNIPGVVYQRIVGSDGNIRYSYISDAAEDLFGVAPKEILSNPQALFDCHGPEYYATFRDRLIEASKSLELWDVEATIYTRDGKRKFTHAIARPHQEVDGSVVWNGVILDQTRIKEAELATAAAEASTRDAIIESIPQAFALFDKEDRLVTWNSRFVKLYPELNGTLKPGVSYAEIVKAEIDSGIDRVEEDNDPQAHYYQRLARHHRANYAAERQTNSNQWILINEHRTADGGTVVLHTDVTELKQREFALEQSNKELEAFASIASHDLQEPLRKIDAFGGRLSKRFHDELGDDGRMYIDRMQSSVARMRELINDLLDYSRISTQATPPTTISLAKIAGEVVGDLQILIENTNGRVEIKDIPEVAADKTQVRQLFQNIIANALKFHRDDVPPVVTIDCPDLASDELTTNVRTLRIADNGIGFDMKYADRIFGIFQRLHGRNEYEGTGVGLATCRKIVERHGWAIRAESTPGEGTTFLIEIPVTSPSATETESYA